MQGQAKGGRRAARTDALASLRGQGASAARSPCGLELERAQGLRAHAALRRGQLRGLDGRIEGAEDPALLRLHVALEPVGQRQEVAGDGLGVRCSAAELHQ